MMEQLLSKEGDGREVNKLGVSWGSLDQTVLFQFPHPFYLDIVRKLMDFIFLCTSSIEQFYVMQMMPKPFSALLN